MARGGRYPPAVPGHPAVAVGVAGPGYVPLALPTGKELQPPPGDVQGSVGPGLRRRGSGASAGIDQPRAFHDGLLGR